MRIAVETIRKQSLDLIAAKLAGRQADVVDDEQIDSLAIRARVKVRALRVA
jgi:hypothetical protein